jgi:hypothetical protein
LNETKSKTILEANLRERKREREKEKERKREREKERERERERERKRDLTRWFGNDRSTVSINFSDWKSNIIPSNKIIRSLKFCWIFRIQTQQHTYPYFNDSRQSVKFPPVACKIIQNNSISSHHKFKFTFQ